MGCLLEIVLWPVTELLGAVLDWMLRPVWRGIVAPAWRAFVGLLNGPAVLLLWCAAFAAMYQAWRMDGGDAAWVPLALFMVPPVVMLLATFSWRQRGRAPVRRVRG